MADSCKRLFWEDIVTFCHFIHIDIHHIYLLWHILYGLCQKSAYGQYIVFSSFKGESGHSFSCAFKYSFYFHSKEPVCRHFESVMITNNPHDFI